jgi:hypothetical protein
MWPRLTFRVHTISLKNPPSEPWLPGLNFSTLPQEPAPILIDPWDFRAGSNAVDGGRYSALERGQRLE